MQFLPKTAQLYPHHCINVKRLVKVHSQVLPWTCIVKITAIIIKNAYLITMFSPYPNLQSAISQATC